MPDLLTLDEARELVARALGPAFVVLPEGYEDTTTYLVRYEEKNGPSWDLDTITVDRATGHVTRHPWEVGRKLLKTMEPVRAT